MQKLHEKLQWLKFLAVVSVISKSSCSNFMHTGTAFCFHTPYSTGFSFHPCKDLQPPALHL